MKKNALTSLNFLEVAMVLALSFLAANAKKVMLLLHEPQYLHNRNTLDAEDKKSDFCQTKHERLL